MRGRCTGPTTLAKVRHWVRQERVAGREKGVARAPVHGFTKSVIHSPDNRLLPLLKVASIVTGRAYSAGALLIKTLTSETADVGGSMRNWLCCSPSTFDCCMLGRLPANE